MAIPRLAQARKNYEALHGEVVRGAGQDLIALRRVSDLCREAVHSLDDPFWRDKVVALAEHACAMFGQAPCDVDLHRRRSLEALELLASRLYCLERRLG